MQMQSDCEESNATAEGDDEQDHQRELRDPGEPEREAG